MTEHLKRSLWLEIDLDRLKGNFFALKEMAGDVKIMPAVKANAYGHGIVQCGQVLEECGADYLGVGSVDEGILLRENGVKTKLLIFESCYIPDAARFFAEYDLIPTVFNMEQVKALAEAAKDTMEIFVKIDTGRGRLGINAEEFPGLYKEIGKYPNLKVGGIYSHMCKSDWPDEKKPEEMEYPMWQYERFQNALKGIGEDAQTIPFLQLANTPASIAYPEIRMTGICPGRAIWGFSPLERRPGHPDIKPPMTALKSRILHVNEVTGGKFGPEFSPVKLQTPKRIGIMAGGIGDGISPKHADGGYVLVHGKRVPIASAICLEHTILDLTDCPEAREGDEVVIFGTQGGEEITMESLLEQWGKKREEFWTSFTPHISRVYYKNGKPYSMTCGDVPVVF